MQVVQLVESTESVQSVNSNIKQEWKRKNLQERPRAGKEHQKELIASLITSSEGTCGGTPLPRPQSSVSMCYLFQLLLSSDTPTETAVFSHADPGPRETAAAGLIPASPLHICLF